MTRLLDRFDHAGVVEELAKQPLILGRHDLAAKIAEKGELKELAPGKQLIRQDEWDTDLFFILVGAFEAHVNGHLTQTRIAGESVGELAGLSRARPRTATLTAIADSVILSISQEKLKEIVGDDARFWRATADSVANQLDHRNKQLASANDVPRIFVISSSEGIDVAREVRRQLDDDKIAVHLWDKGTFGISDYPISSLEDAIDQADFTIAIAKADDTLISRKQTHAVARDNVHFEYGISVGRLGRERSFLLVDADSKVKLPSDLAGLTTLRYNGGSDDKMKRSVSKACDDAREKIEFIGVRRDRRT